MTEKPPPAADYDALAKRYLDLWQDQVAKLAKDPGQLTGAAAAWSQMAASMMQNTAQPFSQPAPAHDGSPKSSASPGPTPSRSAHGDGGMDLADVLRRLDVLEKRLAALESGNASKPAKPAQRRGGTSAGKKPAEP